MAAPPIKTVLLRMPQELWEWVEDESEKDRRSVNSEIMTMLESYRASREHTRQAVCRAREESEI